MWPVCATLSCGHSHRARPHVASLLSPSSPAFPLIVTLLSTPTLDTRRRKLTHEASANRPGVTQEANTPGVTQEANTPRLTREANTPRATQRTVTRLRPQGACVHAHRHKHKDALLPHKDSLSHTRMHSRTQRSTLIRKSSLPSDKHKRIVSLARSLAHYRVVAVVEWLQ